MVYGLYWPILNQKLLPSFVTKTCLVIAFLSVTAQINSACWLLLKNWIKRMYQKLKPKSYKVFTCSLSYLAQNIMPHCLFLHVFVCDAHCKEQRVWFLFSSSLPQIVANTLEGYLFLFFLLGVFRVRYLEYCMAKQSLLFYLCHGTMEREVHMESQVCELMNDYLRNGLHFRSMS